MDIRIFLFLSTKQYLMSFIFFRDEVELKLVNEVVEIREKVSWLQRLLAEVLIDANFVLTFLI